MENNKMFYRLGQENTEYWQLLKELRSSNSNITYRSELSNNWFYTYHAELNGKKYEVVEDIENGIPYSIEILN